MVKKVKEKFYITTPIYYTSGKPHLGHAYTSIACDVIARWNRNIGKEVFFSTGTDEHGQKVMKNADNAKKTPKVFVDDLIPYFREQLEKLNISYDYFIRTTNPDHKKFVAEMLQKSYDNGDIYLGEYEGLYCVDCEQYYKEEDLLEGNICPVHKKRVASVKEENYFFRLSSYQDKLLKFYAENPDFLSPSSKAQETLNRVKAGLEDISISRTKQNLTWGIEVPFDKNHVVYVWFDALFNYISTLEINNKKEFWPADVHIVGKDIMWFHNVYWPAFLMSVGMELPKKVYAHGWWTVDGEKMGKSMGNVIDPIEISQKYGMDEFRFFVLSIGTFGDDLNFTYKLLAEKINNDLNNDLGNLVSRVHAMTNKYFNGSIPQKDELTEEEQDLMSKLDIFKTFNEYIQNLQYNKAIDILWAVIRETNAYINKVAPWKEENTKRLATIINTLNLAIKTFADYIDCFMPTIADRIRKQYNFQKENPKELTPVKTGHKIGEKDNLFTKIKLEEENKNIIKDKKDIPNVFIIHGLEGNESGNWFPWIKNKLEQIGVEVIIPTFPTPKNQNLQNWLKIIEQYIPKINKNTIFIGHSLGVAFILNLLEQKELKVKSVYSVAGFIGKFDLEEKYEWINDVNKSFVQKEFNWEKIKKSSENFYVFQSTNDKFIPLEKATELEKKLKGQLIIVENAGHFNTNSNFLKFEQLFNMIKKELTFNKPKENNQPQNKTGFESLNLKVGKISKVEKIKDSEKLYRLQIDLGNEKRQILSGLQQIYKINELQDRKVVVITNLKAAKLAGEESNGMVLAVENPDIGHDDCGLLITKLDVGTNLELEDGTIANNETIIKSKNFSKIQMTVKKGKVYCEGKIIKGISSDKNFEGYVC